MRGMAAIFCVFMLSTVSLARTYTWQAVQGLAAGMPVKVQMMRSGTVIGRVISVSASSIVVHTSNGSTYVIRRARIGRIYIMGKTKIIRDGLIGAGIGGITGAVTGAALAKGNAPNGPVTPQCCQPDRVYLAAFFGGIFSVIGAIAGALIGFRHTRTLIYKCRHHHPLKMKSHTHSMGMILPAA